MQSPLENLVIYALTAALAVIGTRGMIACAHRHDLLDTPNHRSSHSRPTPRGGGVALVAAFYAALTALWAVNALDTHVLLLLLLGLPIALVGYIDDLHSLSAKARLLVQLACAGIFLALLPGLPPLAVAGYVLPYPAAFVLYLLGIVWLTNLYNFMDGIDGIAAAQAIGVCAIWAIALPGNAMAPALALASAAVGFLRYNYPPARIFMGDVGSGFCGFIFAALALIQAEQSATSPLLWLIPLTPFIADATITLIIRIFRGQRPGIAHRSHAYQRMARKVGRHLPVSAAYFLLAVGPAGITFLWTFRHYPQNAAMVFVLTVFVLMTITAALGAGQDDPH